MSMLRKKNSKPHVLNDPPSDLIVRLEGASREPATPVERLTVSALKPEGAMPFHRLVERVASQLYQEEIRNGAWVLDIGLFGSKLFVADVIGEIEAQNGKLWRIDKVEKLRP